MLILVYRYLKRFDEEVEQINLKQSISKNRGNQHASRLSIIKMTLERETAEYNGGGIGKGCFCNVFIVVRNRAKAFLIRCGIATDTPPFRLHLPFLKSVLDCWISVKAFN